MYNILIQICRLCGGIGKICKYTVFPFPANLTGYTEKVGMENFELLKVLGTGGESAALSRPIPSRNWSVCPV